VGEKEKNIIKMESQHNVYTTTQTYVCGFLALISSESGAKVTQ
jgi:hypothetical protein